MSLNSLPDELVAKIAKRMPAADRVNFMTTGKKYGQIQKSNGLFYKYGTVETMIIHGYDFITDLTVTFIKKDQEYQKVHVKDYQQLKEVLSEVRFVGNLELQTVAINSELVKMLKNNEGKLGDIRYIMRTSFNLSKADFHTLMSLGRKVFFHDVRFFFRNRWQDFGIEDDSSDSEPEDMEDPLEDIEDPFTLMDFLTDKVLLSILPRTPRLSMETSDPVHQTVIGDGSKLTDRLLKAVSKHRPKVFNLENYMTSFTLDGVLNVIKYIHTKSKKKRSYNFGWLKVDCAGETKKKITNLAIGLGYQLEKTDKISSIAKWRAPIITYCIIKAGKSRANVKIVLNV